MRTTVKSEILSTKETITYNYDMVWARGMHKVLLGIEKGEFNCSRVRIVVEGVRGGFTEGVPFVLEVGRRNGNNILAEAKAQRSLSV